MDALRRAGDFQATGSFTLDLAKARDKMARFQLTDPERYVLELVAGAFALGASILEVETGPEGLALIFAGRPLESHELESLDDYLLVAEGTLPPLRYLAVGLNALTRLKPRRVLLESPSGVALHLSGAKKRLAPGKFSRHRLLIERASRLLSRASYASELALIEAEASDGSRAILVNGRDIQRPERRKVELVEPSRAQISLVLHGVVRERVERAFLPCRAVVEDDSFTLNASHSGVVQDAVYHAALDRVRERALERLAELCQQAADQPELLERQRGLLLGLGHLQGKGPWRDRLEELPLFRGPHQRRYSFRELEAQRLRLGFVPTTTRRLTSEPEGLTLVYLEEGSGERSFLEARKVRMQDGSAMLFEQMTARNNRARWEESPRPRELPSDDYARTWSGQDKDVFLAVGLPWRVAATSLLQVLYQGKLLASLPLDNGLCFTAILDFAQLEILPDWSGPVPEDPAYRRARQVVDEKASKLYRELANETDPRAYDQLMLSLLSRGLRSPAAKVELLPRLGGGRTSLEALHDADRVGFVPQAIPEPEVPEGAWPVYPIVRATPELGSLLRQVLGRRLVDARPELERLAQLAVRLRSPRPARLEAGPPTFALQAGGIVGELRLRLSATPPRAQLTVLRQGIELEKRTMQPLAWPYEAIVDSPRLTPAPDWQSVVGDRAWQEVVDRLREAERDAFLALATRLSSAPEDVPAWRDALRAALHHFPELASRAAGLALFDGLSLAQLETELAERGWLPKRRRDPLLEKLLPEARWEEAPSERPHDRDSGPADATPERLELSGELLARRRHPWGEVGLSAERELGDVVVPGLPLLRGLLPRPATAVMTRQGLSLGPDGKVKRDAAFRRRLSDLREAVGALALECLEEVVPGSQRAWMLLHLLTASLPGPVKAKLEEAVLLPMHCASPLSVRALRERLENESAVLTIEPGHPFAPLDNRPIVSATREQAQVLSALFSLPTRSDHEGLARDEKRRQNRRRAAGLKVRLPACLVEAEVQGKKLSGRVGFPRNARHAGLICLEGDRPLGELKDTDLAGFVRGQFELTPLLEAVILDGEQKRDLRDFAITLTGLLARRFAERATEPARARLLKFLGDNKRELGSRSPAGLVLEQLLDLPLFPAAGNRRATPRALLQEASAGRVFYLRAPGAPGEGILPILRPMSLEWEAASRLLGGRLRLEVRDSAALQPGKWLERGWNRLLAGLDRLATGVAQRGMEAERQMARGGEPADGDSAEKRLVRALRREFHLLGGRGAWLELVEGLSSTNWWNSEPLAGAVVFRQGHPVLNWTHLAVRDARDHHERDRGCLVLLAAHIFCEINRARHDVTDDDELAFLGRLARKLRSSYDADRPADR